MEKEKDTTSPSTDGATTDSSIQTAEKTTLENDVLSAEQNKQIHKKTAKIIKEKNTVLPDTDSEQAKQLREGARALILQKKSGGIRVKTFKAVLHNNMINMALVALATIVIAIFIVSMTQEYVGNFTITLDKADALKYGISMSETADFAHTDTKLRADPILNATNISGITIPNDVSLTDASHNGENFIAYTFYLRNDGTEAFNYRYRIYIDEVYKNVDDAVRFALYYNKNKTLYAKMGKDGKPESENGYITVPFVNEKTISAITVKQMQPDTMDKYTVVIWLEGDDPECIDDILGGTIKMSMDISVVDMATQ